MSGKSLKRIQANQLNAQSSTGPRDPSTTRYNAVRHGLVAEGITELDDSENFVAICEQLIAELDPVGLVEVFLARRIALCMIRLRRACLIEAEFVTADLNPTVTEQSLSELLADQYNQPGRVLDPGLPARLSVSAIEELATKFQRYETAIENKLYRAVNQLKALQHTRRNGPSGTRIGDASSQTGLLASFGNLQRDIAGGTP